MTLDLVADIATGILLAAGSFFLVVGSLGIIRMPDVFTRMHAASVSDTLGAGFLLIAMMIQAGFTLVTVKLLIILAVFFFTSPISTHALARAALAVGIQPMLLDRQGRSRRKELGLIGEFITTQDLEVGRSPGPKKPVPGKNTSSAKTASRKSAAKKAPSGKPAETKQPQGKSAGTRQPETKSAESKPAETKAAETKQAGSKQAGSKQGAKKPSGSGSAKSGARKSAGRTGSKSGASSKSGRGRKR